MFGLFKKKEFPLMLNEHMYPVDEKVSVADAKKVFEIFLTKIKFASPSDIKVLLKGFAEEMKDHEDFLRGGLADDKEELASQKEALKKLKSEIKAASDEAKSELKAGIDELEDEVASLQEDVESQMAEYKAFKESKREFTLNYINTLVHGENWRSKIA
jgi:chromosome segregation ATPase